MSRLWCRRRGVAPVVAPTPLDEPTKAIKPVVEPVPEEVVEPKGYTRTEINRMNVEELKALAETEGLDSSLSGAKLKKLLIEHFDI